MLYYYFHAGTLQQCRWHSGAIDMGGTTGRDGGHIPSLPGLGVNEGDMLSYQPLTDSKLILGIVCYL
jgi:hypothetical protein